MRSERGGLSCPHGPTLLPCRNGMHCPLTLLDNTILRRAVWKRQKLSVDPLLPEEPHYRQAGTGRLDDGWGSSDK